MTRRTTAVLVAKLHDDGLSWKHIARIFGVSTRTVFSWANGSTMNSCHLKLLEKVAATVEALDADNPEERLAALFASREGLPSLIDELRLSNRQRGQIINPPSCSAADFFGTEQNERS